MREGCVSRKIFDISPRAGGLTDPASIERTVEAAQEHYGQIDVLIDNAGMNIRKPALEVTWDDWNTVLDTNLRGASFVAQAVAKRMIPRGYGRIVNIGSLTSVFGFAGIAPYRASRGGIEQLTMSLADEWGPTASPSTASRPAGSRPTILVDGGITTGATKATVQDDA